MKLLKMQQDVINSKKRIVVLTAQAGAGTTTALIAKLLDEAYKNSKNMGVFLRRTDSQIKWHVEKILKEYPKSRYSEASSILTIPYNGKNVKIKFLSGDSLDTGEYIPVIAIDQARHFDNIPEIIKSSGRVIIADFMSSIDTPDSWAYNSGILSKPDINGRPVWDECVDHIVGYAHGNPHLEHTYLEALYKCPPDFIENYTRVAFK